MFEKLIPPGYKLYLRTELGNGSIVETFERTFETSVNRKTLFVSIYFNKQRALVKITGRYSYQGQNLVEELSTETRTLTTVTLTVEIDNWIQKATKLIDKTPTRVAFKKRGKLK